MSLFSSKSDNPNPACTLRDRSLPPIATEYLAAQLQQVGAELVDLGKSVLEIPKKAKHERDFHEAIVRQCESGEFCLKQLNTAQAVIELVNAMRPSAQGLLESLQRFRRDIIVVQNQIDLFLGQENEEFERVLVNFSSDANELGQRAIAFANAMAS